MATVRITTTFKATSLVEVDDDFDITHDDVFPDEFEPWGLKVLREHGIIEQSGPRQFEYEFGA